METADVAFVLGLEETAYKNMETGKTVLPPKALVKLCRFYQVAPDAFLEEETAAPVKPKPKKKQPKTHRTAQPATKSNYGTLPPITKADFLKHAKPEKAKEILKKHGHDYDDEQIGQVLDFMGSIAEISTSILAKEFEREQRLEDEPDGFRLEETGYTCRICMHSATGGWYDQHGLRCATCEQAILAGIIPAAICKNKDLYYTEYELQDRFNFNGKTLTRFIRAGLLHPRIIPATSGKGRHYRLFLIADQADFLPPKEMVEDAESGWVEEEEGYVSHRLRWYQAQDNPAEYLKDYDIINYLRFYREEDGPPET